MVFRDLPTIAIIGAVVGSIWVLTVWARARARRRQREMPAGEGYWRGRIDLSGDGGLWPHPSFIAFMGYDSGVPAEISADHEGLQIHPGALARRLRFSPRTLTWAQIAGARLAPRDSRIADPGYISVVPVTTVVIDVIGTDLSMFQPVSDAEAAEEGLTPSERIEEDRERTALVKDMFGDEQELGSRPLVFRSTDVAGMLETVQGRASGRGQA